MELRAQPVSPGIAVGPALVVDRRKRAVLRMLVAPEGVEGEVQSLVRAVQASRRQLQEIKERMARDLGMPHAYIFDAQLLMLEDPLLLDRAVALIREEHINAEWSLRRVSDHLHGLFDEFTDAYLKERATDLDDVLGRVRLNLSGDASGVRSLSRLPGPFVIVAEDLTPSEAAELDWGRVLALATDAGSHTSHVAILARSLGIPAVTGLRDGTRRIPPGSLVIVDGSRGSVLVEPAEDVLFAYREAQQRHLAEERRLQSQGDGPAVTRDGVRVRLQANAEFPDEAETAVRYGAEGVGLFRSEYLLSRGRSWPSEEHQLQVYRRLLERMAPHPVTVRLFDIGAEEVRPGGPSSPNPALGPRALRLASLEPRPFVTQLRALLQAALHGPLHILVPFVTGVADLELALGLLEDARRELRRDGLHAREDVPIGITIEAPGAAMILDILAPKVDFVSIGTNDLVQYLLAADRSDPRVAERYQSLHPAVLRVLRGAVSAMEPLAMPFAVCGEMAADPMQALLLAGLGFRELSMSPAAIPRVKASLRRADSAWLRDIAHSCLSLPTAEAIHERLESELSPALAPLAAHEEQDP
jgi:phosphotransferase system enzyme I (PtsI)